MRPQVQKPNLLYQLAVWSISSCFDNSWFRSSSSERVFTPEVSGVAGGSKPFWQIAEYLSERGFVVLKYDKRGVSENATVINADLLGNATIHSLQRDAESALEVLLQRPEVEKNDITVLGHSEGAVIAPRLAVFGENSDSIKNVVMLGASA